jgi:carboxypeptidase Taq
MNEKYQQLKTILAEITDLQKVLQLLSWDRETIMPPGGAEWRARQLATITRLQHARFASDELGQLLDHLLAESADLDPDSDEARIIKVTKRDYDYECKLSAELVEAISHASSEGLLAWRKAKEAKDFPAFAPYLKRNFELNREVAEAWGYDDRPYDAFVGRWEPGITTAQLATIFSELKEAIVPMVREIAPKQDSIDDSCLHQRYDEAEQVRVSSQIIERFGYDFNRGRIDRSPHPFATSFGRGDVRITTRVYPDFLNMCLFATMHESGHAMYEQNVGPSLDGTLVSRGASGGVHESQSRLWENLVGRSHPFQDFLFPRLQEAFPSQLGSIDKEGFYRAINKVHPSLIRVTADEVTYNLHILLRFELENDMLEERVDISDLSDLWRERMQQYLGVAPDNDADGPLQDIHWSWAGRIGTFPGYTLGNIIGAQLFEKAHKDIPDLDARISRGEFVGLLDWLKTNLYQHGRKFTPNELLVRITGEPVGTAAWIRYARHKFGDIYGL